ncbi:hypothetical protein [Aquibacillus saliphilus]|uniref:hypothetical protein n=1 Tax=Aquibacillus saliphilus TaxID=1909422 RepID=UPI001CF0A7F5|nr:hypothetical protein [Aquibacillus saliphilus]
MSKRNISLSIVFATLIIISLVSYIKISNLENRMHTIDNMQHEIQNVNSSVQSISREVHMQMDEFLQEQLWISEKEYQITAVDIEKNTIDVTLEWSLRDLLDQEEISFLYREDSTNEWTELDVKNNNGLNYSTSRTFPLEGNYQTQVIATSDDGKRSEDLLELKFKEQLDNRIITDAFLHPSGHEQFTLDINIHNRLDHEFMLAQNSDDFKIKSAKAFLYAKGELLKELDLLKENRNFHSNSKGENITYHQSLSLGKEIGEHGDNVELRVIIEDGLGLKYETKVNSIN